MTLGGCCGSGIAVTPPQHGHSDQCHPPRCHHRDLACPRPRGGGHGASPPTALVPGAMRAAGLLLLLLGLPQHPRGGSRCPGEAPPAPAPPGGHNETLGRGVGTARAPDVAALVAVGGWLGAVLLCVRRLVRRSREETRLHLRYLRALPCGPRPHHQEEEEEEPLSGLGGGTGSRPGSPEG